MLKLKFNPKLLICQYFEKRHEFHPLGRTTREVHESDLIGKPFKYEFDQFKPRIWLFREKLLKFHDQIE